MLQKILFPLSEWFMETEIRKKYQFLKKSQDWSRIKIEKYQLKQLRKILTHAYQNVPYYKKIFKENGILPEKIQSLEDLKKIPFLTKQEIKLNGSDMVANKYIDQAIETFTAGSTGTPTKFYLTKEDYSWIWAAHFRAWEWVGYNIGDKYVKISLNKRKKISKKIQDILMRCHYIYALNMTEIQIKKYIDRMIKFKPKFVYGYSSSIHQFAEFINNKGIIELRPKAVITTGDNLLPKMKQDIERAFNAPVYDGYGCGGEGLNIAAQCQAGNYHINDELLIAESINGEAVITSFNNYAMPLIRYKPNDLIVIGNPCTCGKNHKIIKNLDGRAHDVVVTPTGNRLTIIIFSSIFQYIQGIDQFQILQDKITSITIKLVINDEYSKNDEKTILQKILEAAEKNFQINLEYVNNIPLDKNGKRKFIITTLK